jgi:hypothetical protein
MVSQTHDACDWCKRPFDVHFSGAAPAPQKAKKGPSKAAQIVKGTVLVGATILALFVLAHVRTAPDAADIVTNHPVATLPVSTKGEHGRAPGTVAPETGSAYYVQRPDLASSQMEGSTGSASSGPARSSSGQAQGTARLASVKIDTQPDGHGNENAIGTVVIVNTGPYEITDFSLVLRVNGVPTTLTPFEGNVNYPMPISSRHIPPHGQLQVAVVSPSAYPAGSVAARSVLLTATFDKSAGQATDTAELR